MNFILFCCHSRRESAFRIPGAHLRRSFIAPKVGSNITPNHVISTAGSAFCRSSGETPHFPAPDSLNTGPPSLHAHLRNRPRQHHPAPHRRQPKHDTQNHIERRSKKLPSLQLRKSLPLKSRERAVRTNKPNGNQKPPPGAQLRPASQISQRKTNNHASRDVDDERPIRKLRPHPVRHQHAHTVASQRTKGAANRDINIFQQSCSPSISQRSQGRTPRTSLRKLTSQISSGICRG